VLKEKQRELKDTHTTGLSQIDMMTDLIKLLQVRVAAACAVAADSQQLRAVNGCR
jgi:intraflagellar transport protein 81